MTPEHARVIFDEKMVMVSKATGRDVKMSLLMQVGPVDAETIYNQMFACFYSGLMYGRET